jgi:Cys-tRNA(Pro)/Cys-tRNA(Cys) deacylase
MPVAATPALTLVRRAGIDHEVLTYEAPERHGKARDERPDYGLEAARTLGVDAATVFKTLVTVVDGRPVAAVVPVDRQLDLKALAAAVGGRRAELADPADAERISGSVVGGISPLAPRRSWSVVIDASALDRERVCVSAGRRGLQVALVPADLVRLCTAKIAAITR